MNRIYRLVWNRSLRVMQVASEIARTRTVPGSSTGSALPRRRPLAWACLAAFTAIAWAAPAWSATTCPTGTTTITGTGTAGTAGSAGSSGGTGSAGYPGTDSYSSLCVDNGASITGGLGGNGVTDRSARMGLTWVF